MVASRVRVRVVWVRIDSWARVLARISVHNSGFVSLADRARSIGTYFCIRVRVVRVRVRQSFSPASP